MIWVTAAGYLFEHSCAYTCDCGHQSLDALVRGKELELEQAAEAYRNLQWLRQQSEEKESNTLREKDAIISQLQAALQTRSQETQVRHTHTHVCFCRHGCVFLPSLQKPVHVDKPVLLVLPLFPNITDLLTQIFLGVGCFVGMCVCVCACVGGLQDLTALLVARVQAGPNEVVEELKARLVLKEKLFQELLSDRSRQSNEHQAQVQDMLNTLSSKDQYLQVDHVAGMVNDDDDDDATDCTYKWSTSSFFSLSGLLLPALPCD